MIDPHTERLMMGAAGAAGSKTYVDDVFSTYLYKGNATARSITNGIDLAGEGGLVWTKGRDYDVSHNLIDTVRGNTKLLYSNGNYAEGTFSNVITGFNSNGYSLGTDSTVMMANKDDKEFASWTFRKAPGFFDVVTWTGNGSDPRNISHSLGSVPGCILYKRLDTTSDWAVYHCSLTNPATYLLQLDSTGAEYGTHGDFGSTLPTGDVFTVASNLNTSGASYVAYVFAGGDIGQSSVNFDGTGDYLTLAANSGFNFSTGAYTVECWVKTTATNGWIFFNATNDTGLRLCIGNNGGTGSNNGKIEFNEQVSNSDNYTHGSTAVNDGNWHHVAVSRDSGGNTKLYVDGSLDATGSSNRNISGSNPVFIGSRSTSTASHNLNGQISNLRVVNGQALYTSNFTPSTTYLTTTSQSVTSSNVKLLCCNGPGATSSTVASGPISPGGNVSQSTDNPFGSYTGKQNIFGEDGDKNIIQCGSYRGNGSTTGPEIDLGWQPQFVIIKQTSAAGQNWRTLDSMRGIVSGGNDAQLYPSSSGLENTSEDRLELTATGFNLTSSNADTNGTGENYIYIAIRFPDGLVGKPAEAGTEVFSIDAGSTNTPAFDSSFPVDFWLGKQPASGTNWQLSARLTQGTTLNTNTTDTEASATKYAFDYSDGALAQPFSTAWQGWMWKRGQGFDVVTYEGNTTAGRLVQHSLGKIPEMIWVKNRDAARNWRVYHKGLNGGTNPQNYYLGLNYNAAEDPDVNQWNNTAPTSTVFTVGNSEDVNGNSLLAMLFASVDGISKVGSYSGSGSQQTITTGFQPRFLILKNVTNAAHWYVLDTTRGWTSSPADDYFLELDTADAQAQANFGYPIATGFVLEGGNAVFSDSGNEYIYYAHA